MAPKLRAEPGDAEIKIYLSSIPYGTAWHNRILWTPARRSDRSRTALGR